MRALSVDLVLVPSEIDTGRIEMCVGAEKPTGRDAKREGQAVKTEGEPAFKGVQKEKRGDARTISAG